MDKPLPTREAIIEGLRQLLADGAEERPTIQQLERFGFTKNDVLRVFPNFSAALSEAGYAGRMPRESIPDAELLADWAQVARRLGHIPTRNEYKLEGEFASKVFERRCGAWVNVPQWFKANLPPGEWADVLAMVPEAAPLVAAGPTIASANGSADSSAPVFRYQRRAKRPTYGNPIDFRGLRHEPVNEQGVVFLFGMIAKELGFLVEAVQTGYPDCEAKRQVGTGQWQRVLIEFEYESRSFVDHGHDPSGCDVLVCWRHNWRDCPPELEVLELSTVIESLGKSDD